MTTATMPKRETSIGVTTEALQATLVELIDLSLQAKQAHWTVTGPLFAPLHAELDAIVAEVRTWYDDVAERLAALGLPPDGRAATVAGTSPLEPLTAGWQRDADVVARFFALLEEIAMRLRARIAATAEADPVTQDLLIGIAHGIEKHAWMLRAQRA